MSEETVSFNLELNVEKCFDASRRVELILFRVLGLWNRFCRLLGLPADSPINALVSRIQQFVMLIRQLHTAAILLETASGPIGWAMAAIGVGAAVATASDFMLQIGE
jgi:hypothetical protein